MKPHATMLHRRPLWTGESLVRALSLAEDALPCHVGPIEYVEFDAFQVSPGALFIPRFVPKVPIVEDEPPVLNEAIERALFRGATLAITDEPLEGFRTDAPILKVPDRFEAFTRLAEIGRNRVERALIGVTGSHGKTTTKDLLHQTFAFFGPTTKTLANSNGPNGIASTLASIPPGTQFCSVELGTSLPGALAETAPMVTPDIAVLTHVGHSHRANFPSKEAILREKAEVLWAARGDYPVLVGPSVAALALQTGTRLGREVFVVGEDADAFARLESCSITARRTKAEIAVDGQQIIVDVPQPGVGYAHAAAFVLAIARLLGMPLHDVAEAMRGFQHPHVQRGARWRLNPGGRGEFVEYIDDAQNSTPDSMRALLAYLRQRQPVRKVLVAGDMLDLGDDEEALHRGLAPDVIGAGIDLFVGIGPLASALAEEIEGVVPTKVYEDIEDAAKLLRSEMRAGDLIVVKGTGYRSLGRIRNLIAAARFQLPIRSDWLIEDGVPEQRVRPVSATNRG
ncbi:UDP-N-acetylmuramoyl-tripeptide--D-alanyl-D-alanine ligase [Lutimaribacter marinistellae]|uniref:UDP-N-acetylmuramoyl-tripeptide--D-alanyl-D-alanine ligase n=1 Tax=Lutimaribacter marinistellae TaxID=1820329 RepID=A0ABV7TPL4_9RHOB